jgi:hypothetical protein
MDRTIVSSSAFRWVMAIFILCLFAQHAWAAEPVMFSTTRTTATTINNGASAALPLNNGGSTVLSPFGGSKYLIQFHAECSVKANDDNTALTIAIVVDQGEPDQQTAAPTGLTTFELCTSVKPASGAPQHHRQSVGTSVLVNVAGHEYHEIRVLRQMTNFNAGEEALIDELSLTVIAQ